MALVVRAQGFSVGDRRFFIESRKSDIESAEEVVITRTDLLADGLASAEVSLREQVKTWEHYTDEKADVARSLMHCVKSILPQMPVNHAFRTLSIGSSEEPQLKLLHALSDGGLWLYDKDPDALDAVDAIVRRHMLNNVNLEVGDYLNDFRSGEAARETIASKFNGVQFDLITLHHSLYYCEPAIWPELLSRLNTYALSKPGALHVALMSSSTDQPYTTTWLYNRFARKFFGVSSEQNLLKLPEQMQKTAQDLSFSTSSSATRFRPTSFRELMAVVWMIMLYPDIHEYDLEQRMEITEFVFDEFWQPRRDLVQIQDYLTATKSN